MTPHHLVISRPALGVATAVFGAALLAAPAKATELIDSAFSTCTEVDCSATSIAGWVGSVAGQVIPWTASFLVVAGNCLRLEMNYINGPANLEMTVIAPNGLTRWRNDQGGVSGCTNCALVKIDPAPVSGFYSAVISTADGTAVDTDFHLLFGQYNHSNANCVPPTTALQP